MKISIVSEFTQGCVAYISVSKYPSEAVLYSKRTEEYPLSPHLKNIAVAFLQAEILITKRRKNSQFLGIQCAPYKFFSEGPNDLGGSRWVNFQEQVRKIRFDVYKKKESKITYSRLRTLRWKIQCVLSFKPCIYFKSELVRKF